MPSPDAESYDTHHNLRASRQSVLLTGGSSRRMGTNKASIMIEGEELGLRLARLLRSQGWEPTILGKAPLADYGFQKDERPDAGPLAALRAFKPTAQFVFVISCDVPRFDPKLADVLLEEIEDHEAAIPVLDGRSQPLCAVYRCTAWHAFSDLDSQRITEWVSRLDRAEVSESRLALRGVSRSAALGVNTPEELAQLLSGNADVID